VVGVYWNSQGSFVQFTVETVKVSITCTTDYLEVLKEDISGFLLIFIRDFVDAPLIVIQAI
jgi:hypothetical protein